MLYAVPFALYGRHWDWLPWPLATAVVCVLPGRLGWPLFGFVLLGDLAGVLRSGRGVLAALESTCKTADDAMIVFGLYALAAMIAGLHATRGEPASLRLRSERQRLHEVLEAVGTRLQTLGSDLDQAVAAGHDVEAARTPLAAAVVTAREALARVRAAAGDLRGRTSTPIPVDSPTVARLVLAAVFLCNGALQVTAVLRDPASSWQWVLVAPTICAAGAALLVMRRSNGQLAVYALIVGPATIPGAYFFTQLQSLGNLWPFFAGIVVARLRRPHSWVVFATTLAGYFSLFYYPPPVGSVQDQLVGVASFLTLTWLTYSLVRLSGLVGVLHQAREDMAWETVTRERVRVARDLHDRLSFSLLAIALRGELCLRMLSADPEAARDQLAGLPGLARDALAELESITGHPVRLRFDQELAAARELLEAAGARTVVELDHGPLMPQTDAAMAIVLREAVANVVKHNRALTCSISVAGGPPDGVVRLTVVNDGVVEGVVEAGSVRSPGCGLAGMAERTGGRLRAGPRDCGWFEVVAEFADQPGRCGSDPAVSA